MSAASSYLGGLPDHAQKTLNEIQERIREQEQQLFESKRGVNAMLALYFQSPIYTDAELKPASVSGPIRRDQFYGQPLASVVRDVLTRRRAADLGPASVNEIYDAMVEGGYRYDAKDEENAKRGLRISLAKNTATFHKLPSGHYGLRDWYPAAKDFKIRQVQEGEGNCQPSENGQLSDNPTDSPQTKIKKPVRASAFTSVQQTPIARKPVPEPGLEPSQKDDDFSFDNKERTVSWFSVNWKKCLVELASKE